MDPSVIYKLVAGPEWESAEAAGVFTGSAVDRQDGYIHFSTAEQVAETARRHFAGVPGLTLLAVDTAALADQLRWEPSRGGALFPHLYGDLPTAAVTWVAELPDPDAEAEDDPGDAIARAVTDALSRM